jgi:transglutaminase/protease-like cytokinesis protein 3
LSYGGKLPPLKEILRSRIGVCTEFARLYNSLARLAQIPSLMVEGAACGEYKDCRGHSWNVIYVDGKWIEVDPTWNLMSGIVSSSHIYFNDSGQGEVTTEYFNDNKVRLELDFEMKKSL